MRDNLIIQRHSSLIDCPVRVQIGDGWYPARPEGFSSFLYRVRAAWLVFTGRADALVWPKGQ
ncbi:MAG TPA: hypothetical protein VNQ99_06280 [Xanthobacteraceae bacterium]|nr:hypothetical protein [Xanthobacteraceae bacterium]